MKRFIVFIVLLAVVWAIPEARNRIGVAALPLLERLGPVGERAANPFRRWKARNEAEFFLRIISDDRAEVRPLPEERLFKDWVLRRMPEETGVDPWGSDYWLRRRGSTFTVGSSGPDRQRDTADDVTVTETF
ncbi:MAG TPA: hypothetical protein VK933_17670 [Longimicrobiales bacterium]|nr:hypothetical protein [Longimicrobiales bacterium]